MSARDMNSNLCQEYLHFSCIGSHSPSNTTNDKEKGNFTTDPDLYILPDPWEKLGI